jgi:guanylate kinase
VVPVGKDLLLEIDVQGAVAVRKRQPDAVVILIVPPSRVIQESRMRARGDSEKHIEQRLAAAEIEEEIGQDLADFVVLNGELDVAVSKVQSFLADVRQQRRSR